jgi:hypothetical protein
MHTVPKNLGNRLTNSDNCGLTTDIRPFLVNLKLLMFEKYMESKCLDRKYN